MGFLRWEARYSVGVALFDAHHKRLMEIINDLHDGMSARKGKEAVGVALKALYDYAALHFTEEEKRLEAAGYGGLAEQRREHAKFLKDIESFNARHAAGESLVSMDVLEFLRDWLLKHILVVDKGYSAFMAAKGGA